MAVRPLLTNDVGENPGDSDDDPGMDEMMEEFEGERQGGEGEDSGTGFREKGHPVRR